MTIHFKMTLEDLLDFNDYFTLPMLRQQNLKFFALLIPLLFLFNVWQYGHWFTQIFGITPLLIIFLIIHRFLLPIMVRRHAKKWFDKKHKDIGQHIFSIDENGVVDENKTKKSKNQYAWTDIIKIEQNKKSIFLFVAKGMAFIIPKTAFSSSEEARAFYEEALALWKNRKR